MKPVFRVRVLSFSILQEIPGSRTAADFSSLLTALEFDGLDGTSDDELREMCLMALQDQEPDEAARLVLLHDLGDELKEGQIRNIANEMRDEKLWEEYADLALHERLFRIGSLLYSAFPQEFPEPDAVRVTLEVQAANALAEAALATELHESLLVRLLADGMDDQAVLRRLFAAQLQGTAFPEADKIVWIVETERIDAGTMKLNVISSGYWLDPLRTTRSYESSASADGPVRPIAQGRV